MKNTITKQETNAGITRLYGSDGRIYYPPRSASKLAQLRGRVLSRLLGAPIVHSVNKIPSSVGLFWSK